MNDVQLHAILPDGPHKLAIPAGGAANVHALFDDLPVGVYTSLRTYQHNQFLHLADHLDRLAQSMALLGWDYPLDRQRLRRALHQICSVFPADDARVRIDILAQAIDVPGGRARELIGLFPFKPIPKQLYESGVRVAIAGQLSRANPKAKQAQFAQERRPFLDSHPDAYECLLVDRDGFILEGTTSNFYAVKDGVLWTAGEGVLEGVARRIVLKVARETGVPVRLQAVRVDEIDSLDECALSSSSRAIVPIVEIDGRTVADGRPGPVTRRLLAAYKAYVAGAIAPAISE
ncbi:MAG: aminotransferase class IV [Chloroflexota bacterium]|jgi:branched-chain amino acid aminotransferase